MAVDVLDVTEISWFSIKYKALVLSITTSEAFGGTDITDAIGYAVPLAGAEPCDVTVEPTYRLTVVLTADDVVLAATSWLIRTTVALVDVLASKTRAAVPLAVR